MYDLGAKPGDRICFHSENRPEWAIADLAILSLGAINVPMYTTQIVDQIRYILTNSDTRAIFVSKNKLIKHASDELAIHEFVHKITTSDTAAINYLQHSITL